MAIPRIVLDQVKRDNPSSSNIVGWASKVVQRIASLNALARLEVDSECNRLAPIIEGASKDALKKSLIKILSCKRPAQSCLEGSFRSNTIKGPNEAQIEEEYTKTHSFQENFKKLEVSTPKGTTISTSHYNKRVKAKPETSKSGSNWSWKPIALRRRLNQSEIDWNRANEYGGHSLRRCLDFQIAEEAGLIMPLPHP